MGFSERRKEKKLFKLRQNILNTKKLLNYEEAIGYTNHPLFKDCNIIPETKDGMLTGRYYLISDDMVKAELEKQELREQRQEVNTFAVKRQAWCESMQNGVIQTPRYHDYQAHYQPKVYQPIENQKYVGR